VALVGNQPETEKTNINLSYVESVSTLPLKSGHAASRVINSQARELIRLREEVINGK